MKLHEFFGEPIENKSNMQVNLSFKKKMLAEHGITKEQLMNMELKKINRTIR